MAHDYRRHLFFCKIATIVAVSTVLHVDAYAQRPVNEIETTKHVADTSKQRDLIDIGKEILKIKPPKSVDSTGKKVYFSFLPFSTNVPGGGHALITSTTAGFYLGDRKNTYMSKLTFTPYTNFAKRFGLPIRSYVWLKENTWVIDGDIRLLKYPHETWGIGKEHAGDQKINLDYTYFRLYQHALKRIHGGLFMGIGYDLDYRMNIRSTGDILLQDYTAYPYGTEQKDHTISSGVSLNFIYDTRANSINTWSGNYANLQFRINPTFLGSDQNWKSLFLEVRRYHRLTRDPNRQNMIAVRSFFWTVFNSKAPYLDLPNLGWDPYNSSGRGFPVSRFRGKSLYYLETEYRRDITKNGLLGFVTFLNFTTVNGPKNSMFADWNIGTGAGARIKFNKNSGTNIGIDYGISTNHRGVRLTLGEVF
ncbi:BamA/TamA family outer membrane protein [Sphingobacterium thalpophilum]|uniref:BamA/TamA family outer membrane protein n=1 Tax=Sphingobacterium thalpophilum TaxID=259 RepID=A0A4U9VJA1_9SPHI|nr:BamA/TamA family outer membrane protein [Sphingobacterium thalpophilum]VTR45572.1 Outer membrane protein/protective antigen OMA87 [Sphingobacterium thalpophilum]